MPKDEWMDNLTNTPMDRCLAIGVTADGKEKRITLAQEGDDGWWYTVSWFDIGDVKNYFMTEYCQEASNHFTALGTPAVDEPAPPYEPPEAPLFEDPFYDPYPA